MAWKILASRWPESPVHATVRIGIAIAAVGIGAALIAPSPMHEGGDDPSRSLASLIEDRGGLLVDEGSIHWIDQPGEGIFNDLYVSRACAIARIDETALRDLYLVRARLAPSGRAMTAEAFNLTRTWNASDQALVAAGPILALGSMVGDRYSTIEVFDFGGEDQSQTAGWPAVERLKDRITNLQETGQGEGLYRVAYELTPPSGTLSLGMDGDVVVAEVDGGTIRIEPGRLEPASGAELVSAAAPAKAISGHVAWMVDTIRAVPFIGKDKIGWLESRFYHLKDGVLHSFYAIAGDRYAAREVGEEMGVLPGKAYRFELPPGLGKMDLGWPPAPVPPDPRMEPIENEGKWAPFTDERFTRHDPGHPQPLATSFVRPDPERTYASISIVAWDPRMVEIHMQAGVVEPISDTGKAGTGLIPRDDSTMLRLLAAFNGGFQALHGEFGMMQEGKVYLPPKPWAATVARLKGGRIGFGTWPGPDVGEIPEEIVSYRQNLTPLVQDGVVNPYKRHWWGSSPDLNPDSPTINRSAICWTSGGQVLYGLAQSVNEITFAEGMVRAGCTYLIQLDVNSGHSGFEYYRVDPATSAPPPGSPLDGKWEAEGKVRDRQDLVFRARKMYKSMSLMRFPRFIERDPRDYFYLTLARNLPGPAVVPPWSGDVVEWTVTGLPGGQSYPPRFSVLTLRGDDGKADPIHVVQADPRWLGFTAVGSATGDASTGQGEPGAILAFPTGTPRWDGTVVGDLAAGDRVIGIARDGLADEWSIRAGRWMEEIGRDDVAMAFEVLSEEDALSSASLCGALGVGDDRFILWAETPGGRPDRLIGALKAAGARQIFGLPRTGDDACGWAFARAESGAGGTAWIPLVDERLRDPRVTSWLVVMTLAGRLAAVRLFPDTTIVPPVEWNPGQTKRIRYFRPEDLAGAPGPPPDGQ